MQTLFIHRIKHRVLLFKNNYICHSMEANKSVAFGKQWFACDKLTLALTVDYQVKGTISL